jgi:leucyl-tRNA synthetase
MIKKYFPGEIEKKWSEKWDKEKTYETREPAENREKMYVLDMFPYPSGAGLHVGHPRGYTATDILARYYRMNGWEVLHPMGWDAFGLPAENAAIKAKKNPVDMVPKNITNFRRQMKSLGFSYDWKREFSTTDPKYYQWTQWLFIQFFKMGLLYKKLTPVYYCELCKTGLAEEEVLPNGTHERCGKGITRRQLPQWLFRITTYADELLEGLEGLDWPTGILEMQRNWIGKKEGINIDYKVKDANEAITCFTTRPDTNFGATFIVLAPEHEFVQKIINGEVKGPDEEMLADINEYVCRAIARTDLERIAEGRKKTGVSTGFYAVNNLSGRLMPIWISDFVLSAFGTGAVVGVPGHDMRDFEFAQQFKLDVVRVVVGPDGNTRPIKRKEQVYEGEGKMTGSDFLNGLTTRQAIETVINYFEKKSWGKRGVSYHLRDWIFSRQRYWGEPIPMVYCETCARKKISWWSTDEGKAFQKTYQTISKLDQTIKENLYGWFPIDQKNLPLELPYVKSYEPTETGESPLAKITTWVNVACPECGGTARRETDTMPNWAGSCWYFLRFADPHNDKEPWRREAMEKWLPVDWYVGGAEHAVLHLLYSRFWVKALEDLELLNFSEPFLRLRNVGLILAADHRKMSKSLGNVVNPDDVVAEYGADSLRVYEMFMAPFSQEIAWSTDALQGAYRFLKRIWNIYNDSQLIVKEKESEDKDLVVKLHKTIFKVSGDIVSFKFNTAIAAMMEFLNEWEKEGKLSEKNAKRFLKILAPFAPFITEELWQEVLGEKTSIHLSDWPTVEKELLVEKEVRVPVQVDGKVRTVLTLPAAATDKDTVVKIALEDIKVKKFLTGQSYQTVYIPGKILNFVLKK